GGGFFRDHDVYCGRIAENGSETSMHSLSAPQHGKTQSRIGLIQPCGEPYPPWHAVEFNDAEARVREQHIGADHARHVIFESRVALQFNKVLRLATLEPLGHPR